MVNKVADHSASLFDLFICKFIDTHLHIYHEMGIIPNMVTTLNLLFGILAAYEILQGNFIIAVFCWLMAYYFDCVDGKLARKYDMVTTFGDYYDHVSDIIKNVAVVYALIKSNKKSTSIKQAAYLGIAFLLLILMCIHMGYQETIYDKKEESGILNICAILVSLDPNPQRTIQWTKYFGCGTFYICTALIIFFWRK